MTTTIHRCLYVSTVIFQLSLLITGKETTIQIDTVLRKYVRMTLTPIDDGALSTDETWMLASRDRQPIHLKVNVYGQTFPLTLRRGRSIYLPDSKILVHDFDGSTIELSAGEFGTDSVEGYVIGDPKSYVHGHVVGGMFDGIIGTEFENYYVESASKFFVDERARYDAVVYRESDVNFCPERTGACTDAESHGGLEFNETMESLHGSGDPGGGGGGWTPSMKLGRVCKVKSIIDHTMFRDFSNRNLRKAIAHVEFHIREADRMFSVTDFNFDGRPDDIRVRLAALEVFKSSKTPGYLFSDETIDATVFLQKFTMYNHDGICAAMAFTHRPFKDDVLGFAYRGGPNHAGGICYPRRNVNGKLRSLNVGLTSTNAPWGTLAVAQSVVVVTHELGHMFGSMHDEDADGGLCFHNQRQRHYIMSSMANPGKSIINRQFSKCSRRAIQKNIEANGQCLFCRGVRECGCGVNLRIDNRVIVIMIIGSLMFLLKFHQEIYFQ